MELALSLGAPAEVYDVVIIGGGPAGLSAALYAARAKLRTLVVDKHPRAGALAMTELIANYPGVDEELSGAELLARFRRQAEKFGAEVVEAQVLATQLTSDPKQVITSEGTYQGRTVIIAAGALGRSGSIPGEKEFIGRGVSYCAACDAAFFQGKDVAVIGDSREMPDELELIVRFARRVYLLPRKRLDEEVRAQVTGHASVELLERAQVKRIVGEGAVTGVEVVDEGEAKVIPVAGVFVYLSGSRPTTDFLDGSVEITAQGCIAADPRTGATNQPGVFAVGDVTCNEVRQAVVAAGQGALAALAADKYLRRAKRMRQQWS